MPAPTYELTRSLEALTIRVDLPEAKKASEVDLEISVERLHLVHESAELDLPLPCPVKDEEASAKFDKKAHVLTLTLPLVTPGAAPAAPARGARW